VSPRAGTDQRRRGLVALAVIMTVLAALALAAPAAYLLEAYRSELRLYPHQDWRTHHQMKVQLLTMGWLLVGAPLVGATVGFLVGRRRGRPPAAAWAGAATGAFLASLALLVGGVSWFVSNFEVTF
jgi:hypothetical protein